MPAAMAAASHRFADCARAMLLSLATPCKSRAIAHADAAIASPRRLLPIFSLRRADTPCQRCKLAASFSAGLFTDEDGRAPLLRIIAHHAFPARRSPAEQRRAGAPPGRRPRHISTGAMPRPRKKCYAYLPSFMAEVKRRVVGVQQRHCRRWRAFAPAPRRRSPPKAAPKMTRLPQLHRRARQFRR